MSCILRTRQLGPVEGVSGRAEESHSTMHREIRCSVSIGGGRLVLTDGKMLSGRGEQVSILLLQIVLQKL
jgi:hypothetical protein